MQAEGKKFDVFISYRRDGGEYTAKIIRDRLNEQGYSAFFDVESLRSGDFNTKLYSVIEECTDFLLILSPGALDRCSNPDDWVRREIEYALEKGKNIIPVMLRGFEFPERLPESIEAVRFRNGLQSSTQFFDAFMNKLCIQFLQSRPQKNERCSRKTAIAAVAVFLALCALIGGIVLAVSGKNKGFPNTPEERNLTGEFLLCVENNLAEFSLSYKAFDNVVQAGTNFLNTGEKDRNILQKEITAAEENLAMLDGYNQLPPDQLMESLTKTPVSTSALRAMCDETEKFRKELLYRIEHLKYILLKDEGTVIPTSSKMKILSCYEKYYAAVIEAYALCANELLLPVRNEALEEFWYKFLPVYGNLNLSAGNWLRDKKEIEARIEACEKNMSAAVLEMTREIGYIGYQSIDDLVDAMKKREEADGAAIEETDELTGSMLYQDEADELRIRIERAAAAGRDTAEMEKRREKLLEAARLSQLIIGNVREKYGAKEGDDAERLYAKMKALLAFHYDRAALECLDAFSEAIRESDPDIYAVIPDIRLFIESIKETGYRYGIIVTDVDSIVPPNEVLKQGDILVELNGRDCYSRDDYISRKAAFADGESFTVTVLRKDASGKLETVFLQMTKDMPPVYLMDLANCVTALEDESAEEQASGN